jgi:hypothetical protein
MSSVTAAVMVSGSSSSSSSSSDEEKEGHVDDGIRQRFGGQKQGRQIAAAAAGMMGRGCSRSQPSTELLGRA